MSLTLLNEIRKAAGLPITEGRMSEIDIVMQEIASGVRDLYTVMNNPSSPEERLAVTYLQNMYDEIAREHNLHPDDDFEEIENYMMDRIESDHAVSESSEQCEWKTTKKETIDGCTIEVQTCNMSHDQLAKGKNDYRVTKDGKQVRAYNSLSNDSAATSAHALFKELVDKAHHDKKTHGMMESIRKIAGLPLVESYDDDEDPDVRTAMSDKRQQSFEKKAKKIVAKVDADKDMSKLAKVSKEKDDDEDDKPTAKTEAKPAAKTEAKPAATGGKFSSIAKEVLKSGGNAAAVRAALEKAGVAVPGHLHSRLHALKKGMKVNEAYIITHPHMPTFVLAENAAMNQYQWISSKDDSTTLEPLVFETKAEAEKTNKYLRDYKNQFGVLTTIDLS